MNRKTRIMLVEDHPEYREIVALALGEEPDMELTGQFGAAEIALRSLQDLSTRKEADIILLDINLPGMDGIDAISWFKKSIPNAKIIMLTQSNKEADVLRAIRYGAAGYLLKSASIEEVSQSIRTVMAGGASLDSNVAKFILNAMKDTPTQHPHIELSHREIETLSLLGKGLQKKEIANELGISASTVAEHVKRIYIKLEVPNAPAAISKAYQSGILPSHH
jgi:DNA-binding NarL/FixJ family response regulator